MPPESFLGEQVKKLSSKSQCQSCGVKEMCLRTRRTKTRSGLQFRGVAGYFRSVRAILPNLCVPLGIFILPGCTCSWCSSEDRLRLCWICPLSALKRLADPASDLIQFGFSLSGVIEALEMWRATAAVMCTQVLPRAGEATGTACLSGDGAAAFGDFWMICRRGKSCFIAALLFQY